MSGLFARLAARAAGTGRVLRPRVRSRFEPPGPPEPLPLEAASEPVEGEPHTTPLRRPAVRAADEAMEFVEAEHDVPDELRVEPRSPQQRIERIVRDVSPAVERRDDDAEQRVAAAANDEAPAAAGIPPVEPARPAVQPSLPAAPRAPGTRWEETVIEATDLTVRTRERIALRLRPQAEPPDEATGDPSARHTERATRAAETSLPRIMRRAEPVRSAPADASLFEEAAIEEPAGADPRSAGIPPSLLARQTATRTDARAAAAVNSSDAEEDAIVRIHVGRVELRGSGSPPAAPARPQRAAPRVSLENYLQSVQRRT